MSKAATTLTYGEATSHFMSLPHSAAMREAADMGLKIASVAVASMARPELTKAEWLKLGNLADRFGDLMATRDHEQ